MLPTQIGIERREGGGNARNGRGFQRGGLRPPLRPPGRIGKRNAPVLKDGEVPAPHLSHNRDRRSSTCGGYGQASRHPPRDARGQNHRGPTHHGWYAAWQWANPAPNHPRIAQPKPAAGEKAVWETTCPTFRTSEFVTLQPSEVPPPPSLPRWSDDWPLQARRPPFLPPPARLWQAGGRGEERMCGSPC